MLCSRIQVVAVRVLITLFKFLARIIGHEQGSNADRRSRHSGNPRELQRADIDSCYIVAIGDGLGDRQEAGNAHLHVATPQRISRAAKAAQFAAGRLHATTAIRRHGSVIASAQIHIALAARPECELEISPQIRVDNLQWSYAAHQRNRNGLRNWLSSVHHDPSPDRDRSLKLRLANTWLRRARNRWCCGWIRGARP